jgi:acylphosphatase
MSEPTIVAVNLLVSGRVQGVGFRWFVMKRAQELQLTGWVRNLPDGRVEITAKGSPPEIAAFAAAVSAGPRLARVDNVEKSDILVDVIAGNAFQLR